MNGLNPDKPYYMVAEDNDGQILHKAVMFDGSYETWLYEDYNAAEQDINEHIRAVETH